MLTLSPAWIAPKRGQRSGEREWEVRTEGARLWDPGQHSQARNRCRQKPGPGYSQSETHRENREGLFFLVVQSLSHVWLFVTLWTVAHQASLPLTISQSLSKFLFIESLMPSNHLIFCHPLLLLPSIFPSIRVFSNELALCIRWPNYWSSSFSISSSNEYWFSFRIDWFDLLAVQGMLKSLLQHHSSKSSILLCSTSLWSNSHIYTWLLERPLVQFSSVTLLTPWTAVRQDSLSITNSQSFLCIFWFPFWFFLWFVG